MKAETDSRYKLLLACLDDFRCAATDAETDQVRKLAGELSPTDGHAFLLLVAARLLDSSREGVNELLKQFADLDTVDTGTA